LNVFSSVSIEPFLPEKKAFCGFDGETEMPEGVQKASIAEIPFWRELRQQSALRFSLGSQLEAQLPQFRIPEAFLLCKKKTSELGGTHGHQTASRPNLLAV
jgi:hypothetical protein